MFSQARGVEVPVRCSTGMSSSRLSEEWGWGLGAECGTGVKRGGEMVRGQAGRGKVETAGVWRSEKWSCQRSKPPSQEAALASAP